MVVTGGAADRVEAGAALAAVALLDQPGAGLRAVSKRANGLLVFQAGQLGWRFVAAATSAAAAAVLAVPAPVGAAGQLIDLDLGDTERGEVLDPDDPVSNRVGDRLAQSGEYQMT